jgi:hypothetical protein
MSAVPAPALDFACLIASLPAATSMTVATRPPCNAPRMFCRSLRVVQIRHHGVVGVDHVVEGYLAEQVTGMVRVWG